MKRAELLQHLSVFVRVTACVAGLPGCHHAEDAKPAVRSETPAIAIDDAFSERGLGFDLDLLEDPTNALTLDDVRSVDRRGSASRSTKSTPNFSYSKSAWWARFGISDRRSCTVAGACSPFVLTYAYPQSDDVHVQCTTAEGAIVVDAHAGDHVPHGSWGISYREPSFLVPARATECWVRLTGSAGRQFPLTLRSEEAFASLRLRDASVQSAYFGALGVMLAYNLLVAVATGSTAYSAYALFLFSYGLFQFSFGGFAFALLWPNSFRLADSVVPLGVAAIGLASVVFAVILLDLRRSSPGYWRAAKSLVLFFSANLLIAPMVPYGTAIRVLTASAPVWAFFLLSAGVNRARAGLRVANYYLAAWAVFIAGTVTNMIRALGLVPVNALTTNAQQIGSALEFVLLSFALADRIKTLQAEVMANANVARAATERALAEQARTNAELKRLDALKDEFLANTSHELRTPLHGMLGLTEGVLRSSTQLEGTNRDRLEMVVASGRRLASLVNDILDFSKLRHQELTLREKNVDLRAAVSLALSVVSPSAEAKALDLVNEVAAGVAVRADEARLQQILTNLIGNAVKFTPAGAVRVFAEAAGPGERVHVSVQDTGVGISPEAQERIFESFEQGDGSTAREFGGTGLGLAVTKQLVKLHGGAVRVASSPGEGSTFTFDVAVADEVAAVSQAESADEPRGSILIRAAPRSAAALAQQEAILAPPRMTARSPSSMRLLVADDDPVNLEVLRAQLEPEGHEVITARDGKQAVDALYKHGPFDGILLDVMMPVMTGPQAAARMRVDYPHGTLPILMLTAKNRPEDVVAGLKAGADDYLGKPFHRDELLARLDVHLDASKTTRALERFVSSALVELAGEERPAALHPGQGRGRNVLIGRFAMHGVAEFAARLDEATFFKKMNRIVQVLVEQVELHGGIVETMVDEGLCVLFEGDAHGAISTMTHALRAARDVAGGDVSLGAVLHAGHVNVGVVGTSQWVSLRAMGEGVLIAGALGRWGVSRGFGVLVTDAVMGNLDEREGLRRVGTARLGAKGHAVTVFEVGEKGKTAGNFDSLVEWLERGQFGRVQEALAGAVTDDPLVRHLAEAAGAGAREVSLT